MIYLAHSKEGFPEEQWQTIRDHAEGVAELCARFSALWCEEPYARDLGLLHDIGKYQENFQRRIRGERNIQVEHSVCGAAESAKYRLPGADYCIAGHHGGLPDIGTKIDPPEEPTLLARIKRKTQDYSAYREELSIAPLVKPPYRISLSVEREAGLKEFAFWIRMMFSSLTDADFLDTERFCSGERQTPSADLAVCLKKIEEKMASFPADTPVARARRSLLEQVLSHRDEDAELYLMNMPTGSGKTLASMYFALERAVRLGLKRIVYIIPYTSIIEQNAKVFRDLFGEDAVLEHHCNFDHDSIKEESTREKLRHAAENWDAPIIVTTNVQFFESIYGNRPSQARKLHNIAQSVLVFDEVHMFPSLFYQPCLEAVKLLVTQYSCRALFLTATMPDFGKWMASFGCGGVRQCELIRDRSVFPVFERCKIEDIGMVSTEKLLLLAGEANSSLIVVNTRKTARTLYALLPGEKYHLSTYMTKRDRARVIENVKQALVEGRKFVLVSTSLIEAGVDLDFERVFRERAGLDNLLQTAGRCNRNGSRGAETCTAFCFDLEDAVSATADKHMQVRQHFSRQVAQEYAPTDEAGIRAYFDRLFEYEKQERDTYNFRRYITANGFLFESCARDFKLIDDNSIGIIVVYPGDEAEAAAIESLAAGGRAAKRRLQAYSVSLRGNEFSQLLEQGVLKEENGLWFLTHFGYYDEETGIRPDASCDIIK